MTDYNTSVGNNESQVDVDTLVRDHMDAVYRLAYRLTGNPHEAQDLTQDTFVRALRALPNFTPGNTGGWLHRITTNLFLDQVRRKKRIRFDAFPEGSAEIMRHPGAEPDEQYAMESLDGEVRAALMRLKPQVRAAVVLCDLEGMSYDDISKALNVLPGTVRSRIHRGRSQLRRELAHREPTRGGSAANVSTVGA